jgi:hypothetical protein
VPTSKGNRWTSSSLKATLSNPRLCGWRAINDELVRDESGEPVTGQWEPVITAEQWLALKAIFDARRGRLFSPDGTIGGIIPPEYRQPSHLLTGIMRCGKPGPDGRLCNTPLRVSRNPDMRCHLYACPPKTAGGCGGLGRRGDLCDEYISEAVLAKLEERAMTADSSEPWQGEADLERQREKLARLRAEWDDDRISDELFFGSARRLEERIRQLRSEQAKHALTAERASRAAATDVAELRARWYETEDAGGLPVSMKRAYLRESLHAVIVHPAGGGRKPFNPDLLELIWRD